MSEPSEAVAIRADSEPGAVVQKEVAAIEKYRGISQEAVSEDQAKVLMDEVSDSDIEIRPEGMIYLPEIKYRRRLNQAFRPGGWALMPTSQFSMKDNTIMRQYALYVGGRFISETVGEQEYVQNNPNMTYATAAEGCKSNALMRCCKDLGIASELWDPGFIERWVKQFAVKIWNTKKGKWNWRRKDREPFWWEKKEESKAPPKQEQRERYEPPPAADNVDEPIDHEPFPEDNPTPSPAPAPDPNDLISDPQRKRLYAISRDAGLNDIQIKDELIRLGYSSSKDIKKSQYQDIVAHFESMKS